MEIVIVAVLIVGVLIYNKTIDKDKFIKDNAQYFDLLREDDYNFLVMAKYGDKVHFVIVNIDGTKPDVTAFMENHAFSFPVALDTNGSAASAYAVQAIPTSYIIDADSNVVDSHVGALSAGDMESFVTSAF